MAEEFFTRALAWQQEKGYTVYHETHRKRFLHSPWVARRFMPRWPLLSISTYTIYIILLSALCYLHYLHYLPWPGSRTWRWWLTSPTGCAWRRQILATRTSQPLLRSMLGRCCTLTAGGDSHHHHMTVYTVYIMFPCPGWVMTMGPRCPTPGLLTGCPTWR